MQAETTEAKNADTEFAAFMARPCTICGSAWNARANTCSNLACVVHEPPARRTRK